ncbi:hypothetical protein ACOMHN_062053 [Nucella lapillus]
MCSFSFEASTVVLRHYNEDFKSKNWTDFRTGLSGDLRTSTSPRDYFVGLESLHQITSQANYSAKVSLWVGVTGADAFYQDFRVDSENTSYRLTFTKHYPRKDGLGDNGLTGKAPITFSAQGQDPNSCTENRGAPGWYGADCKGRSFFADPVKWPVLGQVVNCAAVDLRVARHGDFYAD